MLTADVLAHFGKRKAIADALGIGVAAVYKWGKRVPPLQAARLSQLTFGKLRFDPETYKDWYSKGRAA